MATKQDTPALNILVNSAYRGEGSKKGWTTEADLLDGTRTTESKIAALFEEKTAVILKATNDENQIIGCVHLQQREKDIYLGMLSVHPNLQGGGVGKQLLIAAEDYAKQHGLNTISITVINLRNELIAWYERHGYQKTGETQPFHEDPAFGIPRQQLELLVMEKRL